MPGKDMYAHVWTVACIYLTRENEPHDIDYQMHGSCTSVKEFIVLGGMYLTLNINRNNTSNV